jgi:hypothetical protein
MSKFPVRFALIHCDQARFIFHFRMLHISASSADLFLLSNTFTDEF